MEEEKTIEEKKMTSRKFLVWVVWGILTVGVIIVSLIAKFNDDLISTVIQDFFFVSLTYLGVNGIQKVGFAVSDAISGKTEEK